MRSYGLYLHIPFCEQKCFYCDFASYSGKGKYVEEYLRMLEREIRKKTEGKVFESIFIGGGTPSYLSAENLRFLGDVLQDVSLTPDYEFTMECNPGNLTREKAEVLKAMGVNRLSIGLQSTNDSILIEIGRIHTFRQFTDNFRMLRELGFDNINVDIIYGLPNETMEILMKTLRDVTDLTPEHISCYSLIIEEFTPFHIMNQKNQLNLPDEDTEDRMTAYVHGFLKEKGYDRYEISNYALKGRECRHNRIYWELRDYVACGTAAHEFVDGVRRRNVKTVEGYIKAMRTTGDASVEVHVNTREDSIEEFIFMGMRLREGISKGEFRKRFGEDIHVLFDETIRTHLENGLLLEEGDRIRFTEKGIELSNYVLKDFILTA
jgi:oxygen-independent coproporphyrinogen-3 oxidase